MGMREEFKEEQHIKQQNGAKERIQEYLSKKEDSLMLSCLDNVKDYVALEKALSQRYDYTVDSGSFGISNW